MADQGTAWIKDTYKVQVEDVCLWVNFMMSTWKNKLYAMGGYIEWRQNNTYDITDSQLRILDFTKPVDISQESVTTFMRLPDNIPRLKWANVFVADGKLRMFGGEHEIFPILDAEGQTMANQELRSSVTNKMWSFNLETEVWEQGISGMGNLTVERASLAFDPKNERGWFYGGVSQNDGKTEAVTDVYRLDPGKPGPEKVTTSDNIGVVHQGEMVFIENAGESGILVVIGGINALEGEGSQIVRPMESVDVFDIASRTWFRQPTTADRGIYPDKRCEMCTVIASAEDNSSHNIYMYGGWNMGSGSEHNDVFILSIPAFHWVKVNTAPFSRDRHRCGKVQEKYMIAYRGRLNGGQICDTGNTYQGILIFDMSRLEWTSKVEVAQGQKYLVPERLYQIIGGSDSGNATFTKPRGGFSDERLATILQPMTTKNYTNNTTNTFPGTTENLPSEDGTQKNGSSIGAIVGSIIGCLVTLSLLVGLFVLRRRNQAGKRRLADPAELMSNYYASPQELENPPQEMLGYGPQDIPPHSELATQPEELEAPVVTEYYGAHYASREGDQKGNSYAS